MSVRALNTIPESRARWSSTVRQRSCWPRHRRTRAGSHVIAASDMVPSTMFILAMTSSGTVVSRRQYRHTSRALAGSPLAWYWNIVSYSRSILFWATPRASPTSLSL